MFLALIPALVMQTSPFDWLTPVYKKPLAPPTFLKKQTPMSIWVEATQLAQKFMPHHFYYNLPGNPAKTKERIKKELLAAGWKQTSTTEVYMEFERSKVSNDVRQQELRVSSGKLKRADEANWAVLQPAPNMCGVNLREIYKVVMIREKGR